MNDIPIKQQTVIQSRPFVQISSRIQMPSNNILIYSTRTAKKRVKQIHSSKIMEPPIHQMVSYRQQKKKNEGSNQDNLFLSKYGRLRISLMQEKHKKRQSFNSSCHSIYDHDIKKTKSLVLKKDFEFAFKKLIVKKPFSSKQTKQKQIEISHELWSSMKVKKQTQFKDKIITQCLVTSTNEKAKCLEDQVVQKSSNKSESKLIKKGFNSYYKRPQSTPKINQLCLSGFQFKKTKTPCFKLKDNRRSQMSESNLKFHIKVEGQIKPWNDQSRRYKTQVNQGKSGEITDWLNGGKH